MRRIITIFILAVPAMLLSQEKVGINTDAPQTILDIRGIDDETSGGNLQLATPSMNHFLHFFGGRGGDPNPFMLFSENDAFRIATSQPNFGNFAERIVIMGDGSVGVNSPLGDYSMLDEPFRVFADQYYYVNEEDQSSLSGFEVRSISPFEGGGQIFTVGKTGFLTGFEIVARSVGPNQSKLSYFIYEDDENGIQLDAGTVILQSTSFDTVFFNTYPLPVTDGQQLFLELRYDSDSHAEWRYDLNDPYEPGDALFYEGAWGMPGGLDFAFASYVDAQYANRLPILSVLDGEGRVQINNYKMPTTYGGFQQVMMSNGAGEVIWGDPKGVFENAAGIVRNTGSHATDDFVFGDFDLVSLGNNKFFFDKDKGAFRTGRITTSDWMPVNIGQFSVATGWNTRASGYASFASGQTSQAIGDYSAAFGLSNVAMGTHAFTAGNLSAAAGANSIAVGYDNVASKESAASFGNQNQSTGEYSITAGKDNIAQRQSSTALGQDNLADGFASTVLGYNNIGNNTAVAVVGLWNDPVSLPNSSIDGNSPLFIVGNGTGDSEARSNAMLVRNDGRVGIGTNSPSGLLHVRGDSWTEMIIEAGVNDPSIRLTDNAASPSADWSIRMDESDGDILDFRNNGSSRMIMKPDGSLAIGTSNFATGYLVSVGGSLMAEGFRCQLEGAWPDYVFESDYNLMPLDQLEASIQKEQHLPGIPSADQVAAEGIDVGEMQKLMMEKIEELTLYIIELDKMNKSLEQKISELSKKYIHDNN